MFSKLFSIPPSIDPSRARYFSLANVAAIGGFFGHLILLLSFSFFHIWQMAWVNVGSLSLFAFVFVANRKGHPNLSIFLAILEIMLHAIVAVLLMGWQSGFYYYLSIVFVVVFLQEKKFDKWGIGISFLNLLLYMGLFSYCVWFGKPFLQVEDSINYFYYFNNLIVSSSIIAMGAFYYKNTANNVEAKLASAYKKITSSIRYAQRIQQSILPKDDILVAHFEGFFVWYQPKDIVSGDFYWIREVDQKVVVCAIDCTGHGVPGAFMTMLAKVLLKNIVLEQGTVSPAAILEKLHLQVVEVLRQKDGLSQDGMDMSICVLDFINKKMCFSGAMNPMFYSQNKQIFELKATKRPIGGVQKRKLMPFEEHTLDLEKGMSFYLFSDGVLDQFKGHENKKFGKKQLLTFFEQNQDLPMNQQGEKLEKTLTDWIGEGKQIDDILVIGFKY